VQVGPPLSLLWRLPNAGEELSERNRRNPGQLYGSLFLFQKNPVFSDMCLFETEALQKCFLIHIASDNDSVLSARSNWQVESRANRE